MVILMGVIEQAEIVFALCRLHGRDIAAVPAGQGLLVLVCLDQRPVGQVHPVAGSQEGVVQGADGPQQEDAGRHVGRALALQMQAHHRLQPAQLAANTLTLQVSSVFEHALCQ